VIFLSPTPSVIFRHRKRAAASRAHRIGHPLDPLAHLPLSPRRASDGYPTLPSKHLEMFMKTVLAKRSGDAGLPAGTEALK
jgi:hypothetical protein